MRVFGALWAYLFISLFKKNETSFLDLTLKLRVDLCKPLTDTKKKKKIENQKRSSPLFPSHSLVEILIFIPN